MPRIKSLFILFISVIYFTSAATDGDAADTKPIWLVVANADLAKPLKPLAEWRQRQGFDTVISSDAIEVALASLPRRPRFLLLVGDDDSGNQSAVWRLPAKRMELYRWRSVQPKQYVSDMAWGDLDGDGVPEIPVGRIPAHTPAQVELVVAKILAYEKQPPTSADLQVAVWLGSPEYNATINAAASGLGVALFQTGGPSWLRPWFVSGNPGDPFCCWPPQQAARFTRQMRKGGIANVLMGHASADAFYSMTFNGRPIWYTAASAAATLDKGQPVAPMFFFSCNSGNFIHSTLCETEAFLFMPGGPVAAIGATTESHPLTNYFSSVSLLKAFGGCEKRLGVIWLNSQLEAKRSRNIFIEAMLRDVEGKLEPEIDVTKLRRDQVLMYSLLGDPATRLKLPCTLDASIKRTPTGWRWKAKKPSGAVRLNVGFRESQPKLPRWNGPQNDEEKAMQAFEAANDAFAFSPLPSPSSDSWEGTVEHPGLIRLVTVVGNTIHVAVLKAE